MSPHIYVLILPESSFMELLYLSLLQGSLSLKLPVGKAVVQSLSFHPIETLLLTAMERHVQVWGPEPDEEEEEAMGT